jgi:hypothetical protein
VESDFVNRNAVNAGFRVRNTRKNADGAPFRPIAQRGLFQHVSDVFPGIMGMMLMIVAVIVMIVIMMVMLVVIMFMIVMFVFVVFMFMMIFIKIHDCAGSCDAVPFIADKVKFPAFKAEFFKLAHKFPAINAEIHKGAEGHVA